MKILRLTSVVLLFLGANVLGGYVDQSKLYTSNQNNVYFIDSQQRYDWYESMLNCIQMDMALLTIESYEKWNEVNSLITSAFGRKVTLWIGGLYKASSRQFYWISNGENFGYTFWHNNQPDFYGSNEYCAQIGWGPNMEWNDHTCKQKFGYICEHKPSPNKTPEISSYSLYASKPSGVASVANPSVVNSVPIPTGIDNVPKYNIHFNF